MVDTTPKKVKFISLGVIKEGTLIKDDNFSGGYKIECEEDNIKSYFSINLVKLIK